MKFLKGVIFGTAISAGAWMLLNETKSTGRSKLMKQGKKIIKNMGMM